MLLFCPEFQSVLANQDDKTAKYVKSVSNTEFLNEAKFVAKILQTCFKWKRSLKTMDFAKAKNSLKVKQFLLIWVEIQILKIR